MAGWQDDVARQKRAAANAAKGTPQWAALDREAAAAEAAVNESLRKSGQRPKY